MPRVYLAGPPFADEYRRRATALVRERGGEPVDPMRRDFRGATAGHEDEIVSGDLADIDSCNAVLASFTAPDEGTAMEAWYAHSRGIAVVAYTGGEPAHPWVVYVADSVHVTLKDAVAAKIAATSVARATEAANAYERFIPLPLFLGVVESAREDLLTGEVCLETHKPELSAATAASSSACTDRETCTVHGCGHEPPVYATTGMPRECAYQASIAVPSSGRVKSARTASHDAISSRSPSTISCSCPSVLPRKSRRIGSTGSSRASRSSAVARRRYSSANGGPAR